MKSNINRRNLIQFTALGGTLSLLASTGLRAQPQAGAATLAVQELADGLLVVSGAGSNVLVRQADQGLLVVDGGLEANADALLTRIGAQTGGAPIATLFNTHWHREQTGLNALAGAAGARILAHENTRQWLGSRIVRPWDERVFEALPAQALPTDTFHHWGELEHGGAPVRYAYLRQAHTDGDIYVHLPEENVLHAGGVVSNDGWPVLDWWTGGSISGLAEAYETLAALVDDDTVIVPANGPLMRKAELLEMRDMYAAIHERVRTMYMAANSPDDTVRAKPAGEFEGRMGNSDQFVLLAHQSLIPIITPDA